MHPNIAWKDGLPVDEKEQAEIAQIRTGGKSTLAVHDAIKRLDDVDDTHAAAMMARIAQDEKDAFGTVDSTVFNEEVVVE